MSLCQALPALGGSAHSAQTQSGGPGLTAGAGRRRDSRPRHRADPAPAGRDPGHSSLPPRPRTTLHPPPPTARQSRWAGGPGRDAGPNPGAGDPGSGSTLLPGPPIITRRLHPQPRGCPPQPSGAPGSRRPALPAAGFCRNRGPERLPQGPRQGGRERAAAKTPHPSAESGRCARPPP